MKVSVVIPTYNRADRIGTAIHSALAQGSSSMEIVVVDDGSTDATRQLVATFGDRVRYVYQENAGPGAARNTGMTVSRGKYIAFLDSDDRWHPWKLDLQLRILEEHPEVGLVFSDFVIEKAAGRIQEEGAASWAGRSLVFPEMRQHRLRRPEAGAPWPQEGVTYFVGSMYLQLLRELPILTSSVVVRRAFLDETVTFASRVRLFEDWEFFARVARRAPIAYIDTATTINVGHDSPGRISRCDGLTRARSYVSLLRRVWMQDARFAAEHRGALTEAYARGLLAVARQALLAGERAEARSSIAEWQALEVTDRVVWAHIYKLCLSVPGGRALLRIVMRGVRLPSLFSRRSASASQCVNPAT